MRIFGEKTAFAILVSVLWTVLNCPVSAQYEMDRIFPDTTQSFFFISDTQVLKDQWAKTNMGKILAQPELEGFRQSMSSQLEAMWTTRFGMKINDVLTLSSKEVGGGLVAYPGKKPCYALVINITGKKKELNEFLTKMIKQVTSVNNGEARKERLVVGQTTLDATVLVIPPDENNPQARTAWYIDLSELLLVTDEKFLAETMLAQLVAGQAMPSISDVPAYKASIARCMSELPKGKTPLIRFFVNPLATGEALHTLELLQGTAQPQQQSTYAILAKQGFDGLQGVGGIVEMATDQFDYIAYIKAYIPDPPQKAFQMLGFQNVTEMAVPKWVRKDLDRALVVTIDTLNLFNNIGPLFDEFLETPGAWDDILRSLEQDESGPRVNLKTDLVACFGSTVTAIRDYVQPLSEESERVLYALDIKPGRDDQVRGVLHRMFDTDPDFHKLAFNTDVIWQYSRPKTAAANTSRPNRRRRVVETPAPEAANHEQLIKGGVFCVSNGYLFISNDANYLKTTVENIQQNKITPILADNRYLHVQDIIKKETEKTGRFFESYTYLRNAFEVNYDLFQAGKFRQGTTFFSQMFRVMGSSKHPARTEQAFDGTKLPAFSEMADKVGYGGMYGRVEDDGWYFERFGVKIEQK